MFTRILTFLLLPLISISQTYNVSTIDIDHFWNAYDQLQYAKTLKDSTKVIQDFYIERGSPYFHKFIESRSFTAAEYVRKIREFPEFWKSIRRETENLTDIKPELDSLFLSLEKEIPGFNRPDVCFAIGCLRTGGTTTKNLILAGAEIIAVGSSPDTSGMSNWLKSSLSSRQGVLPLIAHEAIHTQQYDNRIIKLSRNMLLEQSLKEGVADFMTQYFLGININQDLHLYANPRECEIWNEFYQDIKTDPSNYKNWLYQGNNTKGRPADLGYYIGFKIAEAYYMKQTDSKKAILTLLNVGKYSKVYRQSEYWKKCIN